MEVAQSRPPLGANFWRMWAASGVSNLADGIFLVVLPVIAARLTDSPLLVAGVAFAGRLPWIVFVLVAGALADRLDRRSTMRSVQLLRLSVVGGMALLAAMGQLSLPVLYLAAFVLGVGETLFDTAAQSLLPSIVPRDLLSRANGRLYAIELMMNQFAGPPLGGLLLAASAPLALGGTALGFGLAAFGLTLLSGSFRPPREVTAQSLMAEIREGLGYLIGHRLLRTLAIMVGFFNLSFSAVFAVFVLYAVEPGPMGLNEVGYGLLITSLAAGALVGSLTAERMERRLGRATVLFLCVVVIGSAHIVPAVTSHALVIGSAFFVSSVTNMFWNVITVSLRQRVVPDHMLGRVNASYRLFAWGTMPVGALLGGFLGEALGLRAVFWAAAGVTLALLVFRLIVTDEAIQAAEATGPQRRGLAS